MTPERKTEIMAALHAEARRVARLVGMAAWYDQSDAVLTDAEKAEVRALWDTMPGHTCYNQAFLRWIR